MEKFFDALCVAPVVTYTWAHSDVVNHIDVRLLFLKNAAVITQQVTRVLQEKQQFIHLDCWSGEYVTYVHIDTPGELAYCMPPHLDNIHKATLSNKEVFLNILTSLSDLLGRFHNEHERSELEKNLRLIMEYALRSWLKVKREVMHTWRPFTISNLLLVDAQQKPVQIDDLCRYNSPKVVNYFERKIYDKQSPVWVQQLYKKLKKRYGDDDFGRFIQQTGTFAAELAATWEHDCHIKYFSDVYMHKN